MKPESGGELPEIQGGLLTKGNGGRGSSHGYRIVLYGGTSVLYVSLVRSVLVVRVYMYSTYSLPTVKISFLHICKPFSSQTRAQVDDGVASIIHVGSARFLEYLNPNGEQ